MKLSEALKEDWPEKREVCEVSSNPAFTFDNNVHFYNEALTSCDREIDKEALAKVLVRYYWTNLDIDNNTTERDIVFKEVDKFISTMPTWLKRSKENV